MNMMKRVTLEVSLKPFWNLEPEAIRDVAREIFRQWDVLHRHADEIAVMIWAADGSEILDYAGDLDDTFEWARHIGIANPRGNVPNDPDGQCLHSRNYPYRHDAPEYTYRDLKRVVSTLREVGHEMTGKRIEIGATFDPGGEFARSSFKYERHNEICMAHTMGHKTFVCCYATLNADTRKYASFPKGIPQDTTLGTFLGRQSKAFAADLGFDYLWLSNGFGFGMETWKSVGPLFDGKRFDASAAPEIRGKILQFWRDLRAGLGDLPVEVRGTNLGTGADLATDAVPLREIMEGKFGIRTSAPNSPWAAINGDFGVEMVGYMSRVAQVIPGQDFMYRYYLHDPWWLNSPWLDRYGRQPHDIYLPLSLSRIEADGRVSVPNTLAILTIDDSLGRMPLQGPNEITPHLLRAWQCRPDEPGLVTWAYPYDSFHDWAINHPDRLPEAFFHDWFMRSAINNAMPVNTVVSDRALLPSLKAAPDRYRHTILLSRVPDAGSEVETALLQHVEAGGRALLYGPVERASEDLRRALGITLASPVDGTLDLQCHASVDQLEWSTLGTKLTPHSAPTQLIHRPHLCAGPINTQHTDATSLATVSAPAGESRTVATVHTDPAWQGGAIAWVRGTLTSGYPDGSETLTPDDPSKFAAGEAILRDALAALGLRVGTTRRTPDQRPPVLAISRSAGALWFSGYHPDTLVTLDLSSIDGVPVFVGCDTELTSGVARYRLPEAYQHECRVFVEQEEDGILRCREGVSVQYGISRRLRIEGLKNATVRFLPVPGTQDRVTFQPNARNPYMYGPFATPEPQSRLIGKCLTVRGISGSLLISW